MDVVEYLEIKRKVAAAGFDVTSKGAGSEQRFPRDADEFALKAVHVILNSAFPNRTAEKYFKTVSEALKAGKSAGTAFQNANKVRAMDSIWANRRMHYEGLERVVGKGDDAIVKFCGKIPFMGPIIKYHLAKNIGADVIKPDRHIVGLARKYGYADPFEMCAKIAAASKDTKAQVDSVLWRACEQGILTYPRKSAAADECRE